MRILKLLLLPCAIGTLFGSSFVFAAKAPELPKTNLSKENNLLYNAKFIASTSVVPGSSVLAYKYIFPNGLTLVLLPDNRNPLTTMHFILDAGSDREHSGTTGLAHFFEHMMFRKTLAEAEGHYDQVLNSVGGSGNASTSDSFVTFYSNFPYPALNTMLKLEAERFLHLDISEPYFSTEKGAVISERKLRVENDPAQKAQEALRSITERETPLEWMTIGSKNDVENMSLDAAKSFYKNYYTPSNTLMLIGGPIQITDTVNMVGKYFADWHGKTLNTETKYPNDYFTRDLGKSFFCSADLGTKHYRLVYPSSDDKFKDVVYASVFQALLDDNPEGNFEFRLIKNQLATNFNFYKIYWENKSNPIIISFTLNKEQKFSNVQTFWQQAVDDVYKKNLTDKIKNQVRKNLRNTEASTAESMLDLSETILDNTFFFDNFKAVGQAEKIIQQMTTQSLRQWIFTNLNAHKYYITGVLPKGEAPACDEFANSFLSKLAIKK